MKQRIVKAEILFSRECHLSCSYCAMKTQNKNCRSLADWKLGLINLKKLGCEFIAFYGAEVLVEYEKLLNVIWLCDNFLDIDTTIITSGAVPDFEDKLISLHRHGAKSLSMSFDPLPLDTSSSAKSYKALKSLMMFSKLPGIRDVAAIATLHAKNFKEFPGMVRAMSSHGIWSFFDFIHTDRGQYGTKCSTVDDDLMLKPEHYPELKEMLDEVLKMKRNGLLCHTSSHFIEIMSNMMNGGNMYNWTCAYQDPSWVTIDCDGSVYPCDDYMGKNMDFDMTTIFANWDNFVDETCISVIQENCRCCWNSHVDAHGIMAGKVDIKDYIHGERINKKCP